MKKKSKVDDSWLKYREACYEYQKASSSILKFIKKERAREVYTYSQMTSIHHGIMKQYDSILKRRRSKS